MIILLIQVEVIRVVNLRSRSTLLLIKVIKPILIIKLIIIEYIKAIFGNWDIQFGILITITITLILIEGVVTIEHIEFIIDFEPIIKARGKEQKLIIMAKLEGILITHIIFVKDIMVIIKLIIKVI